MPGLRSSLADAATDGTDTRESRRAQSGQPSQSLLDPLLKPRDCLVEYLVALDGSCLRSQTAGLESMLRGSWAFVSKRMGGAEVWSL